MVDRVYREIDEADLVIADLTLSPANVYLEIGYARGRRLSGRHPRLQTGLRMAMPVSATARSAPTSPTPHDATAVSSHISIYRRSDLLHGSPAERATLPERTYSAISDYL